MADGGIPNKNRADSALTIYRDAMRQYIAPILEREHGPNWIRSLVLNERARVRNERSYDERLRSLETGSPPHSLIDLADIPFLIDSSLGAFPRLDETDVDQMHAIREVRNRIHHLHREGDCTRGEVEAIAGLCILVLERCGLSAAAENIPSLSSTAAEADLQKEREERARREWDRERLSAKPPEELTPQERERLNDYEWQEYWGRQEEERLEQERKERQLRTQELGGRLSAGGAPELEEAHSLGQREDRTVVGWGWNEFGQCDAPAGEFVAMSAGAIHSLGLRKDGTVVGWGWNEFGQCDAPAGEFVAMSAGGIHSLGLRKDGTVVGWGWNEFGQCDAPAEKFVSVNAGGVHNLGLREGGTVVGWGSNQFGQCDTPAEKFVSVSAGSYHSLGLREDGTVVGWGSNEFGQCDAPAGEFVAMSAGGTHSLGLRKDGTVVGWGWNGNGECDAPTGDFAAVSAGAYHSLGLREDGTVVGWGWNGVGQCDAPPELRIR